MKLYNLGSLNIDYVYRVSDFLKPGETRAAQSRTVFPGGKGLNQSVAAARAGAQVVHGVVASKEADFLLQILADSGVEVNRICTVDQPAGHTVIQVDDNGQNCILLFPGTNHALTPDYLQAFLQDAEPGDILLLQNETNCLQEAFAIAREKQLCLALNPSPFEEKLRELPLHTVHWWFCNELEAQALFGSDDPAQIEQRFLALYPESCLVLTLGERGSRYISCEKSFSQPIFPVQTVDTTGAGDTFTGYFLAAVLSGLSEREAMCHAAMASALAVSQAGAAVSIPTLAQVQQALQGASEPSE